MLVHTPILTDDFIAGEASTTLTRTDLDGGSTLFLFFSVDKSIFYQHQNYKTPTIHTTQTSTCHVTASAEMSIPSGGVGMLFFRRGPLEDG
jgi:hypothetical protein